MRLAAERDLGAIVAGPIGPRPYPRATGAKLLQVVRKYIENPVLCLM